VCPFLPLCIASRLEYTGTHLSRRAGAYPARGERGAANYPPANRSYPGYNSSEPPIVIRLPGRRGGGSPAGWSLALLSAGFVGLLVLLAGGLILFYAYYQASNRILPGVQVGDLNLGGKTVTEAEKVLALNWSTRPGFRPPMGCRPNY